MTCVIACVPVLHVLPVPLVLLYTKSLAQELTSLNVDQQGPNACMQGAVAGAMTTLNEVELSRLEPSFELT